MKKRGLAVLALAGLIAAATVQAETAEERIDELERRLDVLTRDVEGVRIGDAFIEPGESHHGLGPAASKVYEASEGSLSIGGYGEALYENFDDGKTDTADFLRAILYFGYKYNDKWVFNSEIELEHANEAFVEFAYLDYLHSPAFNFRAGLVLIPMGLVNELHEPNVFLSAKRPLVENRIIPTTWRENGLGFFGDLGVVSYKAYIVNGLDAEDFSASGLRGGRQKGSKAKAEDLAYVASLDVEPTTGLRIGGSAYHGDSGQDLDVDVSTTIYEGHIDWKVGGFDLRALVASAELDDVAELNRIVATAASVDGMTTPADSAIDSVGERLFGWYFQIGYDILAGLDAGEKSLTPYVRIEEFNTQDDTPAGFKTDAKYDEQVLTYGLNFKPIDEIVFKAEWQDFDQASDQFNLAMGYVF